MEAVLLKTQLCQNGRPLERCPMTTMSEDCHERDTKTPLKRLPPH